MTVRQRVGRIGGVWMRRFALLVLVVFGCDDAGLLDEKIDGQSTDMASPSDGGGPDAVREDSAVPDAAALDPDAGADALAPDADVPDPDGALDPDIGALDPDLGALDPDTSVPNPDMAVPDPDMAVPDPDMAVPDPDMAVPDPDMAVPDPDMAVPDPDMAVPDPDVGPTLDGGTPTLNLRWGRIRWTAAPHGAGHVTDPRLVTNGQLKLRGTLRLPNGGR